MSPLQLIPDHPGLSAGIALYLKRDDLVHPVVQGNKWRKLQYALLRLQAEGRPGVLSFGGAFSNYLHALAQAGPLFGLQTVGVVRGLAADLSNPTLREAQAAGMALFPVPKAEYDQKERSLLVQAVIERFPDFAVLPEGGATEAGVQGCADIARELILQLDLPKERPLVVAVPAGTGCTAAGIVSGMQGRGQVLVFPAAAYGISAETIRSMLPTDRKNDAFTVLTDYLLGKFARPDPTVLQFAHQFEAQNGVQLDPIYTSRMLFGLYDLMEKGFFQKNTVVVAVHTGGLQGWNGVELSNRH